jgi:hypothetical protein
LLAWAKAWLVGSAKQAAEKAQVAQNFEAIINKSLGLQTGKRCGAHPFHAAFPAWKISENINEIWL